MLTVLLQTISVQLLIGWLQCNQNSELLSKFMLLHSTVKMALSWVWQRGQGGRGFGLADSLASHLLVPPALPQLINGVSDTSRIKGSGERGEAKRQGYSCFKQSINCLKLTLSWGVIIVLGRFSLYHALNTCYSCDKGKWMSSNWFLMSLSSVPTSSLFYWGLLATLGSSLRWNLRQPQASSFSFRACIWSTRSMHLWPFTQRECSYFLNHSLPFQVEASHWL